jgi:hypothetical protein
MIWRVGKFTIQQEGRAPALTLIFEDLKTAEQCASAMREMRRRSKGVISSCRTKAGCRFISRD